MKVSFKPGWAMTESQHSLFWRLWNAACGCQHWTGREAEAKRREILLELGFESAKHIDHLGGFDLVKKRLEALADRVDNEREDGSRRRRVLWRIGQARAGLNSADYPTKAVDTILRQRFKVIPGIRTIADLETRELVNLSRTLTARLASYKARKAAISQPAPRSAAGVCPGSAVQSFCNPNAANVPHASMATADLFFQAG
jgi:hypothetical protein